MRDASAGKTLLVIPGGDPDFLGACPAMLLVPCYLAASDIEGLGVYSREPVKRGQLIWRFDPRVDRMISLDSFSDADERLSDFLKRYTYIPPYDRSVCILDGDEGRYMNHSETPNTDFSSIDAGYALQDIPAGVELTCDYREFDITAHVMMASISPLGRQLTDDVMHAANGHDMSAQEVPRFANGH